MNAAVWLERSARRDGDAPALFDGTRLNATYREFRDRAAALAARGVGRGARVALFLGNRSDSLVALYGVRFAGAAAVPINAKLHAKEAAWILENSGAALCFVSETSGAALRGGWLMTGDVGSLDEDGNLTLHDRSRDVIISGGSNIYPREIEDVLLTHADMRGCAVIGRPSVEWGEEVVAFVVARDGARIDAATLDAVCVAEIARFKRPKLYRFVAEPPKNNYCKVLKTELRALLAETSR